MEQLVKNNKKEIGLIFVLLALLSLIGGLAFGSISALQFIVPGFFDSIPFIKSRPLHVSLVVAWIFLSAVGGIYYYLPRYCNLPLYSKKLPRIHFWIFLCTGIVILFCYLMGKFGGREYWEFPPILAVPIVISWLLFGFNYFKTILKKVGQWPVYLWMWGTGIFFFLFTFTESYLWIFPHFGDHIVRDITVQWKSYGALVGSWNMLVYGTAIFLMERISGDESVAKSKLAFFMYFLGFTNLLFGWAHHIYIVPSAPWIRYFAYLISMTELIILGKIIWNWKRSISDAKKVFNELSYKFIVASDFWIFVNLALAILISVPAINIFTHGTHITVAHAMGSTIGINTMILLASCFFIITDITKYQYSEIQKKLIIIGFWITNISLLIFWVSLIFAGAEKGRLVVENKLIFQEIMQHISPYLMAFTIAGLGIFSGILLVTIPAFKATIYYFKK